MKRRYTNMYHANRMYTPPRGVKVRGVVPNHDYPLLTKRNPPLQQMVEKGRGLIPNPNRIVYPKHTCTILPVRNPRKDELKRFRCRHKTLIPNPITKGEKIEIYRFSQLPNLLVCPEKGCPQTDEKENFFLYDNDNIRLFDACTPTGKINLDCPCSIKGGQRKRCKIHLYCKGSLNLFCLLVYTH